MTATSPSDYEELRRLPPGELGEWVRRAYPVGRPIQWWLSIMESIEAGVVRRLHRGETVDAEPFRFASALLMLGAADSVDKAQVGYWLSRLTALAVRCGTPSGLPESLTPNGSAGYVLAAIPLKPAGAVVVARKRSNEYSEGAGERPTDVEIRALQDVELLIYSLDLIRDSVTDAGLKSEISEWLSVYDQLAP